nr:MFS transporter [Streptomyces phaeolivaceus]
MPLSVYVLGLAVFALGTSEFMLSGLLPPIAEDMDVSIPRAGLLISAFAIGMVIGGRVADAHLFGVLLSGITASTVFLVALALLAQYAVAAVLLSFLLGVSCFYTAPALNARLFNVAGAAPTLAGATTTAAFNLGNTGGPWIGGVVIDAGQGFAATAWAGAALTAAALGTTAVSLRLHRRTRASRLVAKFAVGDTAVSDTAVADAAVNPVRTDV